MSLRSRVNSMKNALAAQTQDLTSPKARWRAWLYVMIFDHGALRTFWFNHEEIAPGVHRANQPSPKRLRHYAAQGIRTLINLRGPSDLPQYRFEKSAAAELGLTLIDLPGLSARQAPARDALLNLIETLATTPKPFLIHCKSGADRTSLAAAIYLLTQTKADLATARRQFSLRYIHLRWTKAGVLDHILDTYADAHAETGLSFETWVRTEYDADTLQRRFNKSVQ